MRIVNIVKNFTLWPSLVMLSYFLFMCVFLYNSADQYLPLQFLFIIFFPAFCIIRALYLLFKKKWKSSFSYIFPGLLLIFMFSSWSMPVRQKFFHLRHYIEFQIQKNIFIPEMNEVKSLPAYKEWPLDKRPSSADYTIVYDAKDQVVNKEKHDDVHGCSYSVYKVGEHFYMLERFCG